MNIMGKINLIYYIYSTYNYIYMLIISIIYYSLIFHPLNIKHLLKMLENYICIPPPLTLEYLGG